MNILHLSCSPRGPASESHQLSRKILGHLLAGEPEARVVNRMLGSGAISHVDENYAGAQHSSTTDDTAVEGSVAQSDELIGELEAADVVVIATPMHNLAVPSVLKAWIDHVVRARRTFHMTQDGKLGALRDRPVFVAVASGGRFSGARARQPDFLTPYLTTILGMIGLRNLHFFCVQGTGMGPDAVLAARAEADRALQAHFVQAAT